MYASVTSSLDSIASLISPSSGWPALDVRDIYLSYRRGFLTEKGLLIALSKKVAGLKSSTRSRTGPLMMAKLIAGHPCDSKEDAAVAIEALVVWLDHNGIDLIDTEIRE